MSDPRAERHAFPLPPMYCFVSDEGYVVGVASVDGDVVTGLCLALLDEPVTVSHWIETLRLTGSPREAALALVEEVGGTPMWKFVRLEDATILPPLVGTEPGEA